MTRPSPGVIIDGREDWWNAVDEHWKDLRRILYRYLPMAGHEGIEGEILTQPLPLVIEELQESGDPELARYFEAAWAAAPDSPEIHAIPGWGVLCDLCSERHVLDEEQSA